MTSKEQLTRLRESADELLSAFLGLRTNYGLLAPLLGDASLPFTMPPRRQFVHGIAALRNTLFLSCVLDVVKLSWDRDRRTASIANIIADLEKPEVLRLVKDNPPFPFVIPREHHDGADEAALCAFEELQNDKRRKQVDEQLARLLRLWADYETQPFRDAFTKLRDRHIAHLEVRIHAGEYKPLDINGLNILRSDLSNALKLLGPIVVELNRLLRDADFALDRAVSLFDQHGRRFWDAVLPSGSEGGAA